MMHPLAILLTNIGLQNYTGTELVIRDLAFGLKDLGHFPMIYTPIIQGIAHEILHADIPIVSDLSSLPLKPDIIHGHHHIQTLKACAHFPEVPSIFVCHDRLVWHDIPPQLTINAYVAVDYNCLDRLLNDYHVPLKNTYVIHNWVDTNRFKSRNNLPEKPERALVFSNYAGDNTYLQTIQEVCQSINLSLDVIGSGVNNRITHPEKLLANYDLIFAKAKCALEAMASGAAVILCDTRGLGEMVKAKNVSAFRNWNFGMRLLKQPITSKKVLNEIKKYDAKDAQEVTHYIRTYATFHDSLQKYLTLYDQLLKTAS